jgi:hypothetical protein
MDDPFPLEIPPLETRRSHKGSGFYELQNSGFNFLFDNGKRAEENGLLFESIEFPDMKPNFWKLDSSIGDLNLLKKQSQLSKKSSMYDK